MSKKPNDYEMGCTNEGCEHYYTSCQSNCGANPSLSWHTMNHEFMIKNYRCYEPVKKIMSVEIPLTLARDITRACSPLNALSAVIDVCEIIKKAFGND